MHPSSSGWQSKGHTSEGAAFVLWKKEQKKRVRYIESTELQYICHGMPSGQQSVKLQLRSLQYSVKGRKDKPERSVGKDRYFPHQRRDL